jgi:PAS domain S-box-containing protein
MNDYSKYPIDWPVMAECMTESVLITTADLQEPGPYIIYVNPAFEKMTWWTKEEVIGKSPRILQGPGTEREIFKNLFVTLQRGETWTGRTINYRKDGSEFYMQWSIVPIRNEKWVIHQYLAVQKDVTHLVLTEQKLQKAMEEERKRLLEIEKTNITLNKLIAEQSKTLGLLIKYVPEPIVLKALDQQDESIKEGEQLEAALLFCDIRSFISIAERLNPKQVVNLLNTYYSMMSDVIKKHNGVINQFVGDEIFVSFGAPEPIQDPEMSSVSCAKDMVRKLKEINDVLKSTIDESIVVGIGINYGPIIAGNLGSDDRISYSITGDAVNIAKRIESLTREMPNAILISQSIHAKTKEHISTKPLGEVSIKGKNNRISVFQVLDH